ncbi:MarR family winged helix-turn-helix transcriptional regulator [Catenulispora pinistramenti]|uniref:MarR family winged helix-turn-helix transcriptional regulator n=1 Tax=Catenulispora pinistramenti TaxID=2705254 RepID=UPI0027DD6C9A|nr:MarR family transcriptional regulator [Catenulispora pinistramenti]
MHQDPPLPATVAETAAAVVELLDALHGRGMESLPDGPVPPSQLRALRAIERCEGIKLRALAEALGSRPPATSRLCDRMEADGLIRRAPSASSRREVELWLSPRARRVLAEVRSARVRELQEIMRTLAPDSLAGLSTHLGRLHTAIEERLGTSQTAGLETADAQIADVQIADARIGEERIADARIDGSAIGEQESSAA